MLTASPIINLIIQERAAAVCDLYHAEGAERGDEEVPQELKLAEEPRQGPSLGGWADAAECGSLV